jgi:hypothetical protein
MSESISLNRAVGRSEMVLALKKEETSRKRTLSIHLSLTMQEVNGISGLIFNCLIRQLKADAIR